LSYPKKGIFAAGLQRFISSSEKSENQELDSYHKHRHREKVRNIVMIALAIILVLLNLWVYLMD